MSVSVINYAFNCSYIGRGLSLAYSNLEFEMIAILVVDITLDVAVYQILARGCSCRHLSRVIICCSLRTAFDLVYPLAVLSFARNDQLVSIAVINQSINSFRILHGIRSRRVDYSFYCIAVLQDISVVLVYAVYDLVDSCVSSLQCCVVIRPEVFLVLPVLEAVFDSSLNSIAERSRSDEKLFFCSVVSRPYRNR